MWKEQLEAERSNLLKRVIALRKSLEWFSGPLRLGDEVYTAQKRRETVAALDAATRAYEEFCVKELHRDPWPTPVSLAISPAERAALARRKAHPPARRRVPSYVTKVMRPGMD
jgi:hypothetical protein